MSVANTLKSMPNSLRIKLLVKSWKSIAFLSSKMSHSAVLYTGTYFQEQIKLQQT